MNYQIQIENLGAIEKAEFTITPMTILAGKNGTGKSFVTKFLYSVLKNFITDVYKETLITKCISLKNFISKFLNFFEKEESNIERHTVLVKMNFLLSQIAFQTELDDFDVKNLSTVFEEYKQKISPLFDELLNESHKLIEKDEINSSNFTPAIGILSLGISNSEFIRQMDELFYLLQNPKEIKSNLIKENLIQEIKLNFQVSELKALVRFDSEKAIFTIKDFIEIIIENNKLEVNILFESNLLSIQRINNITFFESPVYWKLLKMIELTENHQSHHKQIITGLPKHFYDLKELLFTDYIDGERPKFIEECAEALEQHLQGKFRPTMGGDLVFDTNKHQTINKSLISFGMTNLGILQAVLNKNIINKGSFIFIDEPESNLHPEWQTILAETLVKLAKNGVYVIVTSHSTDMLKAFDVSTQEQKLDDKLSAHYFQMDGTLLEMNDDYLSNIEQARQKLMENYDSLSVRGFIL